MIQIMFWSFVSGFILGVLDALGSPAWRWILGG